MNISVYLAWIPEYEYLNMLAWVTKADKLAKMMSDKVKFQHRHLFQ